MCVWSLDVCDRLFVFEFVDSCFLLICVAFGRMYSRMFEFVGSFFFFFNYFL